MQKKIINTLIIIITYTLLFMSYIFLESLIKIDNIIIKLFVISLIWTTILWITSLIIKSSSITKPFLSLIPTFLVCIYSFKTKDINTQTYLIIVPFIIWSISITINYLIRLNDLKEEDWRFFEITNKHPKLKFLINLFGNHFLPVLVIYIAILPVFHYLNLSTVTNINLSTIIALIIVILGILIELIANIQMNKFKKNLKNPFEVNKTGLWKISRHPNYLGEIMMWWGTFLMMLSLDDKKLLFFLGPLLITLAILIINIPMMEKRQLNKKYDYKEYQNTTNMLLIFPFPKNKNI